MFAIITTTTIMVINTITFIITLICLSEESIHFDLLWHETNVSPFSTIETLSRATRLRQNMTRLSATKQ